MKFSFFKALPNNTEQQIVEFVEQVFMKFSFFFKAFTNNTEQQIVEFVEQVFMKFSFFKALPNNTEQQIVEFVEQVFMKFSFFSKHLLTTPSNRLSNLLNRFACNLIISKHKRHGFSCQVLSI